MKNTPSKLTFSNNKKKRNVWLHSAGLHTLHLKMRPDESDVEFVERFLVEFFNQAQKLDTVSRHYFMDHSPNKNYINVWKVL